ncbi:MAG: PQQ-binding-like beta-propeller repeat protein [Thermomicrobiales bacterium]
MHTRVLRGVLLLGLLLGLTPALVAPHALAQISADVRDRVLPAVIEIALMVDVDEDGVPSSQYITMGSGAVLSADGAILTNWHVVDMAAHRAELDRWEAEAEEDGHSLEIELIEDEVLILRTEGISAPIPAFRAAVIAEQHALDFAVLQIISDADGYPVDAGSLALPFVPLGDSGALRQGDPLHVFGYPAIGGGTLQYTTGVVSGFGFDPDSESAVWITTDASVSGGSSGGAAVNAAGELVGVPTQGGPLDCRPGDTDGDGDITADDVGCIPTGGSIGQLRPIDLARPMLADAGVTLAALPADTQQETLAATVAPSPTATPRPTSTPAPTPTPAETASASSASSGDVPMYRGNAQRTGEMPGPAPAGDLGVLWEVDLGYGMWGQPALVDGVLYVAAGIDWEKGGIVAAFDAVTGKELWRIEREATLSSLAVTSGVLVYTSGTNAISLLSVANGSEIQNRPIEQNGSWCGAGSSPVVGEEFVFASFGCAKSDDAGEVTSWSDLSGLLIGFDQFLLEEWRFSYTGFSPVVSPALADGIVYIADSQNKDARGTVYAVSATTGQEIWRFSAESGFGSTPIVQGHLAITVTLDGTVYALDASSGLERWRFKMGASLGLAPASIDGRLYVGSTAGRVFVLDLATGQLVDEVQGYSLFTGIAATTNSLYLGGMCGYLYDVSLATGTSESLRVTTGCPGLASAIVANGIIYVATEDGRLIALGDARASVPISDGLKVLIADEFATVRAAPSSAAVVRGKAVAGTAGRVTGPSEEREGETWWPVDVEGIGSGWVQESALMAAEVPPTPTPTPRPTATPEPTATPAPTSTPESISVPTPTAVAVGTDRDISSENLPLLALLPTQDQVPAGLFLVDEAERSERAVAESLGGTEEVFSLLDDWGWSGNAYREFVLPQDAKPGPTGTTFLNVSVHRLSNAKSAAEALTYWADYVVINQGLQDQEPPAIGESARLLTGTPGDVPLTVLYVQNGPFVYRIGGSTQVADAHPTTDVLAVAHAILDDK